MPDTSPARQAKRPGVLNRRGATALLGLAVVMPATAGCADSGPDDRPTVQQSVGDWNDAQPAVGADVRAKAQRLFESFAGTVEQQNALSVLRVYEGNIGMDACMQTAGFPEWDWSLSRTYADPGDPLSANMWLAMPMSRWRSHDLVAAKPFFAAEAIMNADEVPPGYADAVSSCLSAAATGSSSEWGQREEREAWRLTMRWWGHTTTFENEQMPDSKIYIDCMNAADITLLDSQGVDASEVGDAMSGASPDDADIPSDPENAEQWSNPDWQRFLALEDEYDRADWNCRKDVYTRFIGHLDPAMDSFATEHAAEIQQASEFWKQVSNHAAELGYTGQTGSLDGLVGSH